MSMDNLLMPYFVLFTVTSVYRCFENWRTVVIKQGTGLFSTHQMDKKLKHENNKKSWLHILVCENSRVVFAQTLCIPLRLCIQVLHGGVQSWLLLLCQISTTDSLTPTLHSIHLPSVPYPSCRHTTLAPWLFKPIEHTVVHLPLMQISTLPSVLWPFASLISPGLKHSNFKNNSMQLISQPELYITTCFWAWTVARLIRTILTINNSITHLQYWNSRTIRLCMWAQKLIFWCSFITRIKRSTFHPCMQ